MSTQRLSIPQWQMWVRNYGKRVLEAGQRGLVSGGLRAVTMLQKASQEAEAASPTGPSDGGAVNTGAYRRGWRMQVYRLSMFVFNTENYADIIENGRAPGRKPPPRRIIEQWARRRLGMSVEEAAAAAWPIAQAIGQRGLKGRHVMGKLVPKMKRAVEEEIEREVKREITK